MTKPARFAFILVLAALLGACDKCGDFRWRASTAPATCSADKPQG